MRTLLATLLTFTVPTIAVPALAQGRPVPQRDDAEQPPESQAREPLRLGFVPGGEGTPAEVHRADRAAGRRTAGTILLVSGAAVSTAGAVLFASVAGDDGGACLGEGMILWTPCYAAAQSRAYQQAAALAVTGAGLGLLITGVVLHATAQPTRRARLEPWLAPTGGGAMGGVTISNL